MKQSVNQIVNFFKNHKYGRPSLILILLGMVVTGVLLIRSTMEKEPIALSEVALAISAGHVTGIEELQGSDILIIHYKRWVAGHNTTRPIHFLS